MYTAVMAASESWDVNAGHSTFVDKTVSTLVAPLALQSSNYVDEFAHAASMCAQGKSKCQAMNAVAAGCTANGDAESLVSSMFSAESSIETKGGARAVTARAQTILSADAERACAAQAEFATSVCSYIRRSQWTHSRESPESSWQHAPVDLTPAGELERFLDSPKYPKYRPSYGVRMDCARMFVGTCFEEFDFGGSSMDFVAALQHYADSSVSFTMQKKDLALATIAGLRDVFVYSQHSPHSDLSATYELLQQTAKFDGACISAMLQMRRSAYDTLMFPSMQGIHANTDGVGAHSGLHNTDPTFGALSECRRSVRHFTLRKELQTQQRATADRTQ